MPVLSRSFVPLIAALSLGCRSLPAQHQGAAPAKPTLVLFLTVDQLRADYFARFAPQLTGGLKLLHDQGAFYANGFQDHAITETAPGHASTMSGRFPVHTGITMNSLGVNTREAPLIGVGDIGASPFRFQGTTLTDWMRAADKNTRVLSVSRKDRGAILPIGKSKSEVYWWASNGTFTTSSYYADALPGWVTAFNAKKSAQQYAGQQWNLLLPATAYPEPDSVTLESQGQDIVFPHAISADSAAAARSFAGFPMMDSLTLAFALDGVRARELGAKTGRTDLLAVSLSTTDAVGHRFGPDSRELHDQVVRLDRYLGAFLDSLFKLRGREGIVIALTADHGVTPLPDAPSTNIPNPGTTRVDLAPAYAEWSAKMLARGVPDSAHVFDEGVLFTMPALFKAAKVDVDAAALELAALVKAVPGVARADLFVDLAKADPAKDKIARRWLNMFAPDGNVRLAVTLTEFSYWKPVRIATHGSPWDNDARVPILFFGWGVQPGAHSETVRTVDMAPTLAAILGVKPTEKLDGVPITSALKK
ncbi:MAG: alkaline phosphatase family protein [Gemmatimonadaceae bacterium]|nr:alkaline phosphatase family protein [Gemmatimonadaceae bacterium]